MQMKTDKFLKNLIKKLTKTPPRKPLYHYPPPLYQTIIALLFSLLLFIYAFTYPKYAFTYPNVEGFESDYNFLV